MGEVSYVVGLKAAARTAQTEHPSALARRMLAEYGTAQLFEWYESSTVGKVVFDVDGKRGNTTAEQLLADALRGVETFFGCVPARILTASSHGSGAGPGGDKLSFRIFCPGHRMRMSDIKARLVRLGLDGDRPFDSAIYGARQKLRMVGSIKASDDRRPLVLVDDEGQRIPATEALLLDTIVQVVDEAWPLLEEPRAAKRRKTAPAPRPPPSAPSAPTAPPVVLSESDDEDDLTPFTFPDPEVAVPLLRRAGFEDVTPIRKQSRRGSLRFQADRTRPCVCCGRLHERNGFWCGLLHDGRLIVKNYSEHCKSITLGESRFVVPQDRALVIRRQVDSILGAAGCQIAGLISEHKLVLDHAMRAPMDLATLRHVDGQRFSVVSNGSLFKFENILAQCFRVVPHRGLPFLTVSPLEIKVLKSLVESPTEDISHARWLQQAELQAGVHWKADLDDNLFRSRGGLWEPVKPNDLAAAFQIMAHTKLEIILDTLEQATDNQEALKRVRKGATALKRYVGQARSAGQVVIAARRVFLDRKLHETLDRDPPRARDTGWCAGPADRGDHLGR